MATIVADRIKETSTSTGTGNFTLAGAATGFRAFSAKCAVGDQFYYTIQAVNDIGAPSGDWEVGLGTYSATNTLTRTQVIESTNAGAAVNFAAGSKEVFITLPAKFGASVREKLTADRTYYVATTGNDNNTGLSAGSPFLTIQRAIDVACSLDQAAGIITIQLADGTYTTGATIKPRSGIGSGSPTSLVIQGNNASPANVVISTTSANCFSGSGARAAIRDLKLQTTTSGSGLAAGWGSYLVFSNLVFGACADNHIYIAHCSKIEVQGNYQITGGAKYHVAVQYTSDFACHNRTITITNTPAFSQHFCLAQFNSFCVVEGTTYNGSATGVYYLASHAGIIVRNGTSLPGNASGTTSSGGGYY